MNFPSSHLIQFEVYSQRELMSRYFWTILISSIKSSPNQTQFQQRLRAPKTAYGHQNMTNKKPEAFISSGFIKHIPARPL